LGLDKRLEHVFRLALPDIAQARIAPDLETALKRSSADPNTTFVTLNGEIVRAESLIVTGAGDARKAGVLLLKREIKELTAKSALLCGRREESLSIVTSLRNRITELEEKRTGIADQIRDGEKILRQCEDEKREFERELARAEQHIRVVQSETDGAELEQEEKMGRQREISAELDSAQHSELGVKDLVEQLRREIDQVKSSVEKEWETLGRLR